MCDLVVFIQKPETLEILMGMHFHKILGYSIGGMEGFFFSITSNQHQVNKHIVFPLERSGSIHQIIFFFILTTLF